MGGGLRVPRVLDLIKEATAGYHDLSVHLNPDEAMCFGSAFIAANNSASFKVRKVFLSQHPAFEYRMEIRPADDADLPDHDEVSYFKETALFKTSDYLGQKKTIALYYDRSFIVDIFGRRNPLDEAESLLQSYAVDMAEMMADEVMSTSGVTTPKVSLSFELTRSHLLQLNKAEAKVDEIVRELVVPEVVEEVSADSDQDSDTASDDAPEAEAQPEAEVETEPEV